MATLVLECALATSQIFSSAMENGPIEYLHYISYDFLDFLCLMSLEDM